MKKLSILLCIALIGLTLISCSDGSTTMDQGKDTNGRAGETTHETDRPNGTSGENGEGAQEATENIINGSEDTMDEGKGAVNNAGEMVKDAADGASNAVKNATDTVTDAANDMMNKK